MFRPDLSSRGSGHWHSTRKDNGYVFVHYASLPFNGASIIARITVDPKSPDQVTKEQLTKTVKVLMNIPQPYHNHYGGMIAFGPETASCISARGTPVGKAIRSMRDKI
jgi:hypothetical protein